MKYYESTFAKLIENGVPKWFIRLYALDDLAYFSRIYFYHDAYNIEAEDGWYTNNGISITATPADINRKCYGELKSLGFPSWEEYSLLFDGDEFDCTAEFIDSFNSHREKWLRTLKQHQATDYS